MNEKLLDILKPQGECIGEEMLIRYSKGDLSSEEARRVEEHLTGCELCSDALDGIMKSGNLQQYHAKISSAKHLLRKKLRAGEERATFPFTRALAIAATVLLLVVSAWFIQYLSSNESQKIFSDEFKPYPVTISDSIIQIPAPSEANPLVQTSKSESLEKKINPAMKKKEMQNENSTQKSSPEITPDASASSQEESLESVQQREQMVDDRSSSGSELAAPQAARNTVSNFATEPKVSAPQKMEMNDSVSLPKKDVGNQFNNDHLQRAIDLYQNQKYSEAIAEFRLVLEKDSSNPEANFYSGVSELAMSNADEALNYFKKTAGKNNHYYEATLWYESLAYLKKGDKKQAKNLLEEIAKENGEYKLQAEQLLKTL